MLQPNPCNRLTQLAALTLLAATEHPLQGRTHPQNTTHPSHASSAAAQAAPQDAPLAINNARIL